MIRLLVSLLTVASLAWAGEVRLARHPSYHNGKVAFSYAGDIWVVNEDGANPTRITDHRARDVFPRFSPDGRWIAFSSNRYGNNDVYVIPAAGGPARRLTYHTGADSVVGWTRDSKRVVFVATRGTGAFPSVSTLHEVSIEGGQEQEIATGWGSWASYSPDGRQLAFSRHGTPWWRQHYRGTRAADLWIMDVTAKKSRKLSGDGLTANWQWPMWGARNEIYFVSDTLPNEKQVKPGSPEVLQSKNNIWKITERGGAPVQVTKHTSGQLFHPSISADGKVIVYEESAGLWKLDVASGRSSEIKVRIEMDEKENAVETITSSNEADSFDLSPSTRRAVISVHGELFTIATDRGDVTRIAESPARDRDPQWSPDGKWIAFLSDRTAGGTGFGADEVWICDTTGGNLKKLSDLAREKGGLLWAPDSKSLLYTASDKKLYRVNIADGATTTLATGEVGRIAGVSFSPDGKWVSYNKQDRSFRTHIWVVPAAGGEARRITNDEEYFSDGGATWTRDGRHIAFVVSNQRGGGIAQLRQTSTSLYILPLQKLDRDPVTRDVDDEESAAAADSVRRGPGAQAAESRSVEVKIDWDGLTRRARRLAPLAGNVGGIASAPDGRSLAFVMTEPGDGEGPPRSAIYTIGVDGQRMTRVAQSQAGGGAGGGPPRGGGGFGGGMRSLAFSRDGRTLYFQEGQGIYAVDVPAGGAGGAAPAAAAARGPAGGAGDSRRRVTFTARVEIDHKALRAQVFDEGWRIMKHRFYDANMHGVDWNKQRDTYRPLLEHAFDTDETHNVMLQAIGELNASHTGVGGGGLGRERGEQPQTRYPGFELLADSSGYYKVGHIYKAGPADKEFLKIKTGDYLLALDDTDLKTSDNYWQRFTGLAGRKFKFLVNSKPAKDGAWEVRIESLSGQQQGDLQYEKWVADRRAMVEKMSNGEVGYLHIRAMNAPSLRRFERELEENALKKALVIDQRFNGGGGIEQELLQILQQRRYQYTVQRDSVQVSRPQRAFFGPMVVMENERSGSNAEMFPHGFRELKLGKVVGVHSFGGVIGTGSYTLLDGSAIRTPGSGVFTRDGINMENFGVPPDIFVDNTPDGFLAGRDEQLEKAVETLRAQLRATPSGGAQ